MKSVPSGETRRSWTRAPFLVYAAFHTLKDLADIPVRHDCEPLPGTQTPVYRTAVVVDCGVLADAGC